jgi:hypothetical protein
LQPNPTPKGEKGGNLLFNNPLAKGLGTALGPFAKMSKSAVTGPAHLLAASAHMMHIGGHSKHHDPESENYDADAHAEVGYYPIVAPVRRLGYL